MFKLKLQNSFLEYTNSKEEFLNKNFINKDYLLYFLSQFSLQQLTFGDQFGISSASAQNIYRKYNLILKMLLEDGILVLKKEHYFNYGKNRFNKEKEKKNQVREYELIIPDRHKTKIVEIFITHKVLVKKLSKREKLRNLTLNFVNNIEISDENNNLSKEDREELDIQVKRCHKSEMFSVKKHRDYSSFSNLPKKYRKNLKIRDYNDELQEIDCFDLPNSMHTFNNKFTNDLIQSMNNHNSHTQTNKNYSININSTSCYITNKKSNIRYCDKFKLNYELSQLEADLKTYLTYNAIYYEYFTKDFDTNIIPVKFKSLILLRSKHINYLFDTRNEAKKFFNVALCKSQEKFELIKNNKQSMLFPNLSFIELQLRRYYAYNNKRYFEESLKLESKWRNNCYKRLLKANLTAPVANIHDAFFFAKKDKQIVEKICKQEYDKILLS